MHLAIMAKRCRAGWNIFEQREIQSVNKIKHVWNTQIRIELTYLNPLIRRDQFIIEFLASQVCVDLLFIRKITCQSYINVCWYLFKVSGTV